MAFNLDFSGWKAAREAQADSIRNQATIAANLRAQKAKNLMDAISAVGGAGVALYDRRKKEKEEIDKQVLENGLVIDPMQAASANNKFAANPTQAAPANNQFAVDPMQEASANNLLAPNGFFPDDEDRAGFLSRIFSFLGGK